MLTFACSSQRPKFPMKTPRAFMKARRAQKKRDAQLKTLVNDIGNIANHGVERLRDIAKDMLEDPSNNPIVVVEKYGYEEDDDY